MCCTKVIKWIVAVFRRVFQRQRVAFEDRQDEESFTTKLEEKKKARKDVDEYGQLSLRDYVDKRLTAKKEELHSFTTTRGFARNILMGLVVSVTALATAFSAKVWELKKGEELRALSEWIPFLLSIVSALLAFMRFCELDTSIPTTNDTLVEITKAEAMVIALGESICLQEYKEKIVEGVENALLERVQFSVIQIENLSKSKNKQGSSSLRKAVKSTVAKVRGDVSQQKKNKVSKKFD